MSIVANVTSASKQQNDFQQNLVNLSQHAAAQQLNKLFRGIEKESLRITPDGRLSQSPHPKSLGSTLTHPNITTDYSEALIELITEPHQQIDDLIEQLTDIHQFVYQNLDDEMLWVNSMPCILGGDLSIPIAQYGSSNIGKMKTVYRHGLWHRYGRLMQAIAGVHFNFSFPESFWKNYQHLLNNNDPLQDFISAQYFKLIRNFQRFSWLPVYLFGASPAVCGSFVRGRQHRLQKMGELGTYYLPDATSLRMSDLGYQNDAQSNLMVCYNSIETYTACLEKAIRTPYKPYEEIGVKKEGEYLQLNANILQIENEFYSSIRPKRPPAMNERPTQALRRRGVEYIEVRCLDLNPYEPIGLDKNELLFLDAFLITCLLESNVETTPEITKANAKNTQSVVYNGRNNDARIIDVISYNSHSLKDSAATLLGKISQVAELLDKVNKQSLYQNSIKIQKAKVADPGLTASGKIIGSLQKQQISFFDFSLAQAEQHREFFKQRKTDERKKKAMQEQAKKSLEEQKQIEKSDDVDFDTFVANYFKD